MGSIALQRVDVIVGVDTLKAEHVGFAIGGLGGDLGDPQDLAIPSGYAQLLAWADSLGPVYAFGVEGTARRLGQQLPVRAGGPARYGSSSPRVWSGSW